MVMMPQQSTSTRNFFTVAPLLGVPAPHHRSILVELVSHMIGTHTHTRTHTHTYITPHGDDVVPAVHARKELLHCLPLLGVSAPHHRGVDHRERHGHLRAREASVMMLKW